MTHPQQPTESPIFTAMSPSKRQVLQRKPFTLSSARPRTSPHRHMPRATPRAICPITRPRQSRMQFPNRSDSAARTNTNRQDARGELHAKLLSCTTVSGRPRPEAAAGPGHSHQNHRRRRCGERRQGQSKHTRTKPRSIGGRRGACGAWPGFETTRRAKLAARTASGRAGHAAAGDLAGRAMPEIWRAEQCRRSGAQSNTGDQAGSHNRQRPGRLLHNSPHGSSPRCPRRICYDVRPVAPHARSYCLGRGCRA